MNHPQTTPSETLGTESLSKATTLLKAMANYNRLRVLELLCTEELSVTEINQRITISQSALSQHLAILRRDNLVNTRRESQTIYYSLKGDLARVIIGTLANLDLEPLDLDDRHSSQDS
ncbi:ArsR/SmtB family transcription factor [Halomonas halocynthiae]|uniref:ArsR/SmtB family transcription factor n=1 Tax=Halomonas halocynthiae TaxID=176290 RepID=UPI0003FD3F02|nr:metalloregulator ArsR/SmtB family transcription factor [Halomonas halocynthiae]